jgi:poly(hydroxyalkanoate) depolymerase family esterase
MAASIVALIFAIFMSSAIAQNSNSTILIKGAERAYQFHAPAQVPPNSPLVFSIHGLNQTNTWMRQASGFDRIADRDAFVVVYPQALNNASNQPSWNLSGTTELDFILALIDTMVGRYQIDRNRVYSTGFSMGGMLSYYLTCNASDKIAAIAPVSGYLMGGIGTCNTKRSMPIHHIHGAADDFVKYVNLPAYLKTLANKFGCKTEATVTQPYPSNKPSQKVKMESWGPCDGDTELNLVSIESLGHAYTTGPDLQTTEEAWSFLKKYSLAPGVGILPSGFSQNGNGFRVKATREKLRVETSRHLISLSVFDVFGRRVISWDAPLKGLENSLEWEMEISLQRGSVYWIQGETHAGKVTSRLVLP